MFCRRSREASGTDRRAAGVRGQLGVARANRPRQTVRVDSCLDESRTHEVSAALRQHVASVGRARFVAHAARQIAQSQSERGIIEVGGNSAGDDRLQLTDASVLPTLIAEVLPRGVAGTDRTRRMDGEPFVHEKLTQRNTAARFPIRVFAVRSRDELA